MDRYFFQVGDQVIHSEVPTLKGTIFQQVTEDEGEIVEQLDNTNCWYLIDWESNDNMEGYRGFECQISLLPSWCNTKPTLFIQHVYQHNKLIHDQFKQFCKNI